MDDVTIKNEEYMNRLNDMKEFILLNQQNILPSVRLINPQKEFFYNNFVANTHRFSSLLETFKHGVVEPVNTPSIFNLYGFFSKERDEAGYLVESVLREKTTFNNSRLLFLLGFNPDGYRVNDKFKKLYGMASFDTELDLNDPRTFNPDLVDRVNSFYET